MWLVLCAEKRNIGIVVGTELPGLWPLWSGLVLPSGRSGRPSDHFQLGRLCEMGGAVMIKKSMGKTEW